MEKVRVANIIVPDKFIDGVIECQTLFPLMSHDYLYVSDIPLGQNQYLKRVDQIVCVSPSNFIDYLVKNEYNAVFLHNFTSLHPSLTCRIPLTIKVFWFAWGADIYERPYKKSFVPVPLYKKETIKFIEEQNNKNNTGLTKCQKIKIKISDYIRSFRKNNIIDDVNYKALQHVDYFSGVLSYEYDLMKQNLQFRAKRVEYSYPGGLNSFPDPNMQIVLSKGSGNILLGNSGSMTNNHLDALALLRKIDLQDKKIILPMSYGGNNIYLDKVKNVAKKYFEERVIVLSDYLPIKDYNNIIKECNVAVFYTERQQAVGNICMAIFNGQKIFLSETCGMYSFFLEKGLVVFSIQSDLCDKSIREPLTKKQVENNIRIISNYYCKDKYIERLKNIYNCIC